MSDERLSAQDQLKPLNDLWMHQNTLMWSRIQLLSVLQGAALATNYLLHNTIVSVAVFIVVVLATLYLNYIWEVDREIRNSYRERLDKLGFKVCLTDNERREIHIHIIGIRVPANLHARISLTMIFWGMLVVDAVVFVASLAVFGRSN